jgi:hypothetical protein
LYSKAKSGHIEENIVGEACSKFGEKINANVFFWRGNLKENDHLEDLGVGGGIILIRILKIVIGRGLDSSGSV